VNHEDDLRHRCSTLGKLTGCFFVVRSGAAREAHADPRHGRQGTAAGASPTASRDNNKNNTHKLLP